MLDLTAAETARTFGAWGLAQAMSRGLATVTGGAVLDLGKTLFTMLLAYGLVFALQALGNSGSLVSEPSGCGRVRTNANLRSHLF